MDMGRRRRGDVTDLQGPAHRPLPGVDAERRDTRPIRVTEHWGFLRPGHLHLVGPSAVRRAGCPANPIDAVAANAMVANARDLMTNLQSVM